MQGHPGPKRAPVGPLGRHRAHMAYERPGVPTSHHTPQKTAPAAPDFASALEAMELPAQRIGAAVLDSSGQLRRPSGRLPGPVLTRARQGPAASSHARGPKRRRRLPPSPRGSPWSWRQGCWRRGLAPKSFHGAALGCDLRASHRHHAVTQVSGQHHAVRHRRDGATAAGDARTGACAVRSISTLVALVRGDDLYMGSSEMSASQSGGLGSGQARRFTITQCDSQQLTSELLRARRLACGWTLLL